MARCQVRAQSSAPVRETAQKAGEVIEETFGKLGELSDVLRGKPTTEKPPEDDDDGDINITVNR